MTTDAVKRALDAATNVIYVDGGTSDPDLLAMTAAIARHDAAKAIAAFLRALPDEILFARLRGDDAAMLAVRFIDGAEDFSDLAASVTRAAQEDSGYGQ